MIEDEYHHHLVAFRIDPTDPHNEQLAMAARDDLNGLLQTTEGLLAQAEDADLPLASVLAVHAAGIVSVEEELMPRERLAGMLALACVHLCAFNRAAEQAEVGRWLREVAGLEEVPDGD